MKTLLEKSLRKNQEEYVRLQGKEKEKVGVEDAAIAYMLIERDKYNTVQDFYVGAASLNLLNTYVKQKESLIDYRFKRYTKQIIKSLANKEIKGIKMDLQMDKGMKLLLVSLCDEVQFSFHNPTVTNTEFEKLRNKSTERIEWDGIRKQQCAVTVFHNALKLKGMKEEELKEREEYKKVKEDMEEGRMNKRRKGEKEKCLMKKNIGIEEQKKNIGGNGKKEKENIAVKVNGEERISLKEFMGMIQNNRIAVRNINIEVDVVIKKIQKNKKVRKEEAID